MSKRDDMSKACALLFLWAHLLNVGQLEPKCPINPGKELPSANRVDSTLAHVNSSYHYRAGGMPFAIESAVRSRLSF